MQEHRVIQDVATIVANSVACLRTFRSFHHACGFVELLQLRVQALPSHACYMKSADVAAFVQSRTHSLAVARRASVANNLRH